MSLGFLMLEKFLQSNNSPVMIRKKITYLKMKMLSIPCISKSNIYFQIGGSFCL